MCIPPFLVEDSINTNPSWLVITQDFCVSLLIFLSNCLITYRVKVLIFSRVIYRIVCFSLSLCQIVSCLDAYKFWLLYPSHWDVYYYEILMQNFLVYIFLVRCSHNLTFEGMQLEYILFWVIFFQLICICCLCLLSTFVHIIVGFCFILYTYYSCDPFYLIICFNNLYQI